MLGQSFRIYMQFISKTFDCTFNNITLKCYNFLISFFYSMQRGKDDCNINIGALTHCILGYKMAAFKFCLQHFDFFLHFDNTFQNRIVLNAKRLGDLILTPACLHLYTSTVESRYLEVDGTIFYKFKLPPVQINLHFG